MDRIFYTMELHADNILHLNGYCSWAQSWDFFLRICNPLHQLQSSSNFCSTEPETETLFISLMQCGDSKTQSNKKELFSYEILE